MSRRKRIYGKRRRRSPVKQVKIYGTIPTGINTGHVAADYGVKRILPTAVGSVGAVAAGTVIGAGMFLSDAYKSGQKHSGGRIGYTKNPNYKEGGEKFGDQGSTSQFMPKKSGQKHTSFWGN